jgi:hypothetical protein
MRAIHFAHPVMWDYIGIPGRRPRRPAPEAPPEEG